MQETKQEFSIQSTEFVLRCLLCEHIFSYFCSIYRAYDIKAYGLIDINGIKRAVNESKLANIQFIIQCLIIGYSFNIFIG